MGSYDFEDSSRFEKEEFVDKIRLEDELRRKLFNSKQLMETAENVIIDGKIIKDRSGLLKPDFVEKLRSLLDILVENEGHTNFEFGLRMRLNPSSYKGIDSFQIYSDDFQDENGFLESFESPNLSEGLTLNQAIDSFQEFITNKYKKPEPFVIVDGKKYKLVEE